MSRMSNNLLIVLGLSAILLVENLTIKLLGLFIALSSWIDLSLSENSERRSK